MTKMAIMVCGNNSWGFHFRTLCTCIWKREFSYCSFSFQNVIRFGLFFDFIAFSFYLKDHNFIDLLNYECILSVDNIRYCDMPVNVKTGMFTWKGWILLNTSKWGPVWITDSLCGKSTIGSKAYGVGFLDHYQMIILNAGFHITDPLWGEFTDFVRCQSEQGLKQ